MDGAGQGRSSPSSPSAAASACWSAGSSYGAEAFTLAGDRQRIDPARAGRDPAAPTSTAAWSRAPARAASGAEDARTAPPALLQKWFDPVDEGGWQAKTELMRMTRFEVGDLLRMPVRSAAATT